ncbi:MAG: DUF4058 family protein [Chloroflexota bacterium]
MALLDHFRPPLSISRYWHGFHNAWATEIASDLNARLPEGYFAQPNVQFGIEIDVAAFEEPTGISQLDMPQSDSVRPNSSDSKWIAPPPTQTMPFDFLDQTVEVAIFGSEAGPTLIGAIELVSPANKDRAKHRQAFISKCETCLRQGIGLVIVDIVTTRKANLHQELLAHLGIPRPSDEKNHLYTSAYRPVERTGKSGLDIWEEQLSLGQMLPTMPLWLGAALCLPIQLEQTYSLTCKKQRISGKI